MRKIIFSPEAIKDLEEIWLYIAQDSPARADGFLDQLYSCARRISQHFQKSAQGGLILIKKCQPFLIKDT